jgi:hypothetical protein
MQTLSLSATPFARLLLSLALGVVLAAPLAVGQVSFFTPPGFDDGLPLFVADFNGDGKPDILASTGNSSSGALNLGNGDGTFTLGTPVPGTALAVADFNGDGKPDVLEQGTQTLLVLLGNGDGTFQAPISSPSFANLTNVGATDLNGDGKPDVVGIYNDALFVFLNKGDGTFALGVSYSLGTTAGVRSLVFGDFNNDNKTDVAVTVGVLEGAATELVFLGNGDGTFQVPKSSPAVYGYAVTGDFNGDGKFDLAIVAQQVTNAPVFLLLGNGDGTFQAAIQAVTGTFGLLAAADINGDGKQDLILWGYSVAQIYLGNGDGTFSNVSNYILSLPPATTFSRDSSQISTSFFAIADFNLDGKLDIAVGGVDLLGNGDGTFRGIRLSLAPGVTQTSPQVVGDFENKGIQDVAVFSAGAISILSNDGTGVFSVIHTYGMPGPVNALVTTDLNGDGNLDLLVAGTDPNTQFWSYTVLLGNGDGSFQPPAFYPQNVTGIIGPQGITIADFNKDHKPDLAIGAGDHALAVLLGNGDGTFSAPAYLYDGNGSGNTEVVLTGDFNSDGNTDILAGVGPAVYTAILYGKGDGTFQVAVFPPSLNNWGFSAEFTADLNHDGKPDLLSSDQVALGNGDGTFDVWFPILGSLSVNSIADLNGDGNPDLIAQDLPYRGFLPTQSHVLMGNGGPTFGQRINVPPNGILPSTAVVGDMNGDNRPDIIFPWQDLNGGASGVGVLINTTESDFQISATPASPATLVAGNSATSTVTVAALNGFNSAVALTCSSGVSGVTCSLNPSSVTPSGNTKPQSALTINTTTATAPGTYTITVTGTSGSIQHSTGVALTVQAATNFTIGPASGSQTSATVSAGGSARFMLDVTSQTWSGTVNLACSISPAATSAPTCTLPGSVNVTAGTPAPLTVTMATTAPVTTGTIAWPGFPSGGLPFVWVMFLFASGLIFASTWPRQPRLAAPLIVLALVSIGGCGGGSSPPHTTPGTPAGTYTVTVEATAGSVKQSTSLTVMVE